MRFIYCNLFAFVVSQFQFCMAQVNDTKAADSRMQTMHHLVRDMEVQQEVDGKTLRLPVIEQPLLHYNDPGRQFEDGTLWGFGLPEQRPQALVTCYTKNSTEGNWIHAITSVSEYPLTVHFDSRMVFSPPKSDVQYTTLPNAEPPGQDENQRITQMKSTARRFTAHQFWDPNNQRTELQLMTTHSLRYSDQQRGITDGVIFLFTRDNNPEVCLIIEAIEKGGEKFWQFGIAKIGSAEFHVELDEKEVWKSGRAPGVVGRKTDSYAMFFSKRKPK